MSEDHTSPPDATSSTLDFPLPCAHCGYNLQGLDPERSCPECGTPIERSLRSDFLSDADPAWVRKLADGANLIAIGIVIAIVVGLLSGAVAAAWNEAVGGLLTIIPAVIHAIGTWWVTTPEPGTTDLALDHARAGEAKGRALARWGVIVSTVSNSVASLVAFADPAASTAFSLVGGIAGLVGFFALFVYARRLALRIPDEALAKQTRTVMWGFIVSYAAIIVLVGIIAAATGFAPTPGGQPGGMGATGVSAAVFICVGAVALLVFSIWAIVLAFSYRSRLRRAAEAADRGWSQEPRDALRTPASTPSDVEPWNR